MPELKSIVVYASPQVKLLGAIDANCTVTALNQTNLEFERDKLMPIKSYNLLAILFNKPITVFDVDASEAVPTLDVRAVVSDLMVPN